ncbi:hypothetical protein FYJ51_05045 [Erysipelotrichaceae bacterium Oil+RF-744-GAM-WT-6]|jgi:hypothetical protein|uniref:Uncharacterized protein n=1 Tax=Stecheria intestinalis TaxID=2606630 RepID=A0A7X2NRN5_9FIRM|nr:MULTISPECIES: hypothetical protein [Erysipelotrichaceae]MCI2154836.1 hypothetical protein [Solobacterium sp.]MDY3233272.1 hypothetical protein [Erysipelotrichaceae bacterium]MDY4681455.1 hypothetical protein [Lachnospiraceae bacterium]MCI6745032.1 hypothetical protein [Anaerolactibacter massiliensis]MDD5881087.1 hypothetical protein [Stecheria intestinalis]
MNAYEVTDLSSGTSVQFRPVMYEDCMNPGNWKTIEAEKTEENGIVRFRSAEHDLLIPERELGRYSIREFQIEPVKPSRRKGCIPCTNCGQCGW